MHLLVAIDDSAHSHACIREVAARPWPEYTRVRVLSVTGMQPAASLPFAGMPVASVVRVPPSSIGTLEVQAQAMESARRVAQEAADLLASQGLPAQIRVREGTPAGQIVQEARAWPADLIVLGTRDRSTLRRLLFGSVVSYVMNHAPCSVEVVRQH
jgi:nucleotide-binding universal stress UspA family protein